MARTVDSAALPLRLRTNTAVAENPPCRNPGPPLSVLRARLQCLRHSSEQHIAVNITKLTHLPPQCLGKRIIGHSISRRAQRDGQAALRLVIHKRWETIRGW